MSTENKKVLIDMYLEQIELWEKCFDDNLSLQTKLHEQLQSIATENKKYLTKIRENTDKIKKLEEK
jgi:hypothetical protein